MSCTVAAGQQKPSILGVVHKVGGLPVSHAEVRIEGAGTSETSDSGEFALLMTANLHVGMAAVFHVMNWIILKPCELKSGRTYLRDPSAEPIELIVLARGDARLKSAKANVSIIGCLIEEQASDFAPKPKSEGAPRSALPTKHGPVFPIRTEKSYAEAGVKAGPHAPSYQLVEALYHYSASRALSEPETEKPKDAVDAANDEFLARKAKELGFTVEELKSAINDWAKSVEDPYEKGLAALHELRYAEASQYISASIPSPAGAFVDRYVPLARAEYELGQYAAAESALRKVLAVHSDDPVVLNNLALTLDAQARYSEAEPLYQRALAIDEKALGPNHPNVATNLNNLAALYKEQGKYSEAEALYQRALAIDEKAFGPNHPNVATNLNNLAALYRAQGKYSEAEALYQRALAIDEKALGPNHPNVAANLNNLATLYYGQGKYSEAEPLYQRALAIYEKALGPNHADVAGGLNNLAALYDAQGKYSEAEPLYQRASPERAVPDREPATGAEAAVFATELRRHDRRPDCQRQAVDLYRLRDGE
jgi:tetratricopeptide (TPR) repeat protein